MAAVWLMTFGPSIQTLQICGMIWPVGTHCCEIFLALDSWKLGMREIGNVRGKIGDRLMGISFVFV
jgi:hypothetical protein